MAQLYLRIATGIGFLVPGLDRLGVWGAPGGHNISWGDWAHFTDYSRKVMFFLPPDIADIFAAIATVLELVFGVFLLLGIFIRWTAIGSGLLTFCFAVSMAAAFGITSPLNYSVYVVSAASFLLAVQPYYAWSIDAFIVKRNND